jgi:hypothetical protein
MVWYVHAGSGFFSILDPGSRGQKGTVSRVRLRITALLDLFKLTIKLFQLFTHFVLKNLGFFSF